MSSPDIGQTIVWLETCESTMDEARERAMTGQLSDGSVLAARQQEAGRGRHGRTWHTDPRLSLAASVVLAPRFDVSRAPLLTVALGAALTACLRQQLGLPVEMKWPNDIVDHESRKLAGILVEAHALGTATPLLVAGIGMNLGQGAADFPRDLRSLATSIALLSPGRPWPTQDAALELVVTAIRRAWPLVSDGPALESLWRETSGDRGRRVRVQAGDRTTEGTVRDFEVDRGLLIEDDTGTLQAVRAEQISRCERIKGDVG